MAEVTGRPAATLHKLLGFNLTEGRFERDQDDPLDTEALMWWTKSPWWTPC
jgi:exodeoxyribonuclease V alpha subunit